MLLQGIFLTQELNPHLLCLLHWMADSLPLSHLGSILTPYTKINSKWIKGLNVRLETIKVLEEYTGRTLSINLSKILYAPHPRVMVIKTKVSKWDLVKLKSFCTAKKPISKVK